MVTASISPLLRNRVDVPMVTINHGQDVTLPVKLYQRYLPKVFNSLDGVISVSSATRQQCIERGMGSKKGIALPNGFDLESMERLPEKSAARKEMEQLFNIDLEDKFLLLSVGRQVKRKGHQWFVETVFERIQSDVIYLLIGDGPEHENIGKAVERIRNGGEIILAGKQPDKILSAAYAAADLFIMPNIPVEGDMEGFGIVLLEANRAAVPAVASDLEGIKDVIEQGVNGYRVPHSKPEKFADKIDFVLKNELNELSEHSLSYVKESFSWQHVAEKYVSYLQTVIERKE
jgi:phosphatidylinositol alpha-1,6-mannosyltransferase